MMMASSGEGLRGKSSINASVRLFWAMDVFRLVGRR